MTSGGLPPAVWVASLSQYPFQAENQESTLMSGCFLLNAVSASCVRLCRSVLPHQAIWMVLRMARSDFDLSGSLSQALTPAMVTPATPAPATPRKLRRLS